MWRPGLLCRTTRSCTTSDTFRCQHESLSVASDIAVSGDDSGDALGPQLLKASCVVCPIVLPRRHVPFSDAHAVAK